MGRRWPAEPGVISLRRLCRGGAVALALPPHPAEPQRDGPAPPIDCGGRLVDAMLSEHRDMPAAQAFFCLLFGEERLPRRRDRHTGYTRLPLYAATRSAAAQFAGAAGRGHVLADGAVGPARMAGSSMGRHGRGRCLARGRAARAYAHAVAGAVPAALASAALAVAAPAGPGAGAADVAARHGAAGRRGATLGRGADGPTRHARG